MTVRHITESSLLSAIESGTLSEYMETRCIDANDDPRTWTEYCEPRETDGEWPDDEARECAHRRGA